MLHEINDNDGKQTAKKEDVNNTSSYTLYIIGIYFSPVIAATPGRTLPSIASNIAPPPVDT